MAFKALGSRGGAGYPPGIYYDVFYNPLQPFTAQQQQQHHSGAGYELIYAELLRIHFVLFSYGTRSMDASTPMAAPPSSSTTADDSTSPTVDCASTTGRSSF